MEDARRQRGLRLVGVEVIEFTSDEVFGEPDRVQAELAAHLARRRKA
jgi:very-short-patch-repair endonuclease